MKNKNALVGKDYTSRLGKISFALCIFTLMILLISVLSYATTEYEDPMFKLVIGLAQPILMLAAFILSVIDLLKKNRKKLFSKITLVVSALFLVVLTVFMILILNE